MAQDPQDFLPLTPAEFHILLVLADTERHGYGIMQEVKRRSRNAIRIGPGTLYSTLNRLLERGWVAETDSRVDPALDDERRRYYRLSDSGRRVLTAEAERLANIVGVARDMGLLGGAKILLCGGRT